MATVTTRTQQWPLNILTATPRRSRPLTVALWVISVATAGMFLMAGSMKLAGARQMVQMFGVIGVGQWFRYVTGSMEVIAALALLVPSLALYGGLALALTMLGAIFTHLVIVGGSPAVPAALLVSALFIAWTHWGRR